LTAATSHPEGACLVAVINHKGGVGKTTTSVNLGAALASLGVKTLLADLDPQAHLTYSLGVMAHDLPVSIADCLRETIEPARVMLRRGVMNILPSGMALSALERELAGRPQGEKVLAKVLGGIGGHGIVLIDCPPNLGALTVNALAAAHAVLVPAQPEFLALQSLGMLERTLGVIRQRLNPNLKKRFIVFTRFQRSRKLHREVLALARKHYGQEVLESLIKENIALAEAPSHGLDIFNYRPGSSGARDYLGLARELRQRMGA
jgi:chromosome partitioning protein